MGKTATLFAALGVVVVGMLPIGAQADDCLIENNDAVKLPPYAVYENGDLKFRIDGWKSPEGAPGTVDIRSNAPAFNGTIATDVRGARHFFVKQDRTFCPGSEITANCEFSYTGWNCFFSEF